MTKAISLSLLITFLAASPAWAHPSQFHTQAQGRARVLSEMTDRLGQEERNLSTEVKTRLEAYRAAQAERRLTNLKELCTKMVDHRLKALERAKAQINESELTTEQKNQLLAEVEAKITAVTTYQDDCSSATDLEVLRTMLRQMQQQHHIFASILPKIHALRFADRAQAFIGRLENHVAVLEKRIGEAGDDGCDVTEAEAALADYEKAVQEAQRHLNLAKDVIAQIKDSEDATALKADLKEHMGAMKDELLKARDAHKIIVAELKECRSATTTE